MLGWRNAIIHFWKLKSITQTARSGKLHFIDTPNMHPESTLGSWVRNYLNRWVNCLQFFLYNQAKLITLTQNTEEKNAPGVFSPKVWDSLLHSITFLTAYWKPKHLFWTFEVPDGKVQNMDPLRVHGPGPSKHGPGPWIRVHGSPFMDQVHRPHIFTALKLVVIKDYEYFYNFNSCFLLKSLRSAHTMGLVPATSPCKSLGLVASCELATSPCD